MIFQIVQTWNDAIAKCKGLGEGWRLPTLDELNKLYNNKDKIGGFKDSYLMPTIGVLRSTAPAWYTEFLQWRKRHR